MNKKKGFTILEMIIVVGLLVILLPTIFAILSTILRQQLRLYRMVEVKRQGDAALSFIKGKILREGVAIENLAGTAQCTSDAAPNNQYTTTIGNQFKFQRTDGSEYYFWLSGNSLQYVQTGPSVTTNLTASTVTVSDLVLSCFRRTIKTNTPIMIQISYTVTSVGTTSNISLPYKTKVRLLTAAP